MQIMSVIVQSSLRSQDHPVGVPPPVSASPFPRTPSREGAPPIPDSGESRGTSVLSPVRPARPSTPIPSPPPPSGAARPICFSLALSFAALTRRSNSALLAFCSTAHRVSQHPYLHSRTNDATNKTANALMEWRTGIRTSYAAPSRPAAFVRAPCARARRAPSSHAARSRRRAPALRRAAADLSRFAL